MHRAEQCQDFFFGFETRRNSLWDSVVSPSEIHFDRRVMHVDWKTSRSIHLTLLFLEDRLPKSNSLTSIRRIPPRPSHLNLVRVSVYVSVHMHACMYVCICLCSLGAFVKTYILPCQAPLCQHIYMHSTHTCMHNIHRFGIELLLIGLF
jgi:hypothetical protein